MTDALTGIDADRRRGDPSRALGVEPGIATNAHGDDAVRTFLDAWLARDVDALTEVFAPDVVLHSPIIQSAFRGREAARELYEILFEAFGHIDFRHQSHSGHVYAFSWSAELQSRLIEGAELIRVDANGQIAEITVFMRPLAGLAAFASAVGPRLASRRGRYRAPVVGLMGSVLRAISKVADFASPRLTQRR